MGNQQSGNYQLTSEQYNQYQHFLQHQQQQQQSNYYQQQPNRQNSINRPNMPVQQQPNVQKKTIQNNFNIQQQQRTQMRVQNQNIDSKIIPNLQQKSQMPSVENSFQSAYSQRMSDNFNNISNYQAQKSPAKYQQQPPANYQQQPPANYQQQPPANYQQQPPANYQQQPPGIYNKVQNRQNNFNKVNNDEETRRQNFFNEIDEIEQLKYNPLQILGLSEDTQYTAIDIKKAYRNLAIRYHPDKGGSEEVFKILTKAYIYLLKRAEGDSYVEKNFMDLKNNFDRDAPNSANNRNNSDDFNVKNFNKIFEDNRLEDEERDYGYGDWKTTDTSEEPTKIFNQKFTTDIFNQVFNELKHNKNTTQDVIVFEEPKTLTTSNRLGFSEVDYKRTGDFSKEYDIQDGNSRQGIYYMDYKRAYTETTLISPEAIKPRQEFKNIEDAQISRDKQDFTMTAEEKAYLEDKKRKEDEFEAQRLDRLRKRDDQLERHNSQVNRLLLGNQPQATRTLEYQRR
jgi:curved DNA-binding protein CbpA